MGKSFNELQADHERAMRILNLLDKAQDRLEVVMHSAYYDVFSNNRERIKDLNFAMDVIERIQNYYIRNFCPGYKTK